MYDINLDASAIKFASDQFSIPYSTPTSHLSERMQNSTLLTSYRVKYLSATGISYKLIPYMPLCLFIKLIPLLLLLIHCGLSNGFSIFIFMVVSNILYFLQKKTVPPKI